MAVCYLLLLTWLLFHVPSQNRQFMKNLDPSLGVPLEERSYGDNCPLIKSDGTLNWEVMLKATGIGYPRCVGICRTVLTTLRIYSGVCLGIYCGVCLNQNIIS